MKVLLDENLSDPRLAARLRASGHDPILAPDVGLLSATDARLLIFSITQDFPVLTRDSEDFEDLHDLVISAAGHHAGILIVRFDNDPRHNLTDRGIATAVGKLESSGIPVRDRIHVLNPSCCLVVFGQFTGASSRMNQALRTAFLMSHK
jgi:predicted nuclease of predicted toxin-antitoxin system